MKKIFHKTQLEVNDIQHFGRYDFKHYGGMLQGGFDTPGLLIGLYGGELVEIDYGKNREYERDMDYRYLEGAKGY